MLLNFDLHCMGSILIWCLSSNLDTDGEGGRRLDETTDDDSTLSLVAYNSYTQSKVAIGETSNSEYPWGYIVEPYRATTLELQSTTSGASYRWMVDGHLHGFGTSVEALFTEIGYHIVKVEESIVESDGTTSVNKLVVKVMCKYVRREIRGLSNLDREAWLSAVQVIQHVPTTVGRSIYGSKFFSKDAFTRVHLYYGGAMDCDHWHQVLIHVYSVVFSILMLLMLSIRELASSPVMLL